MKDSLDLLSIAAQVLFDKKGFNILVLDVREISNLTDFFLIAEGNIDKHVISLAREVMDALRLVGCRLVNTEGLAQGDWVVLDYDEMVIHLFMPGVREKYQLEQLWKASKIVNIKINTHPEENNQSREKTAIEVEENHE